MIKLIPNKLTVGDTIRIVAPARSLGLISEESRAYAEKTFTSLGLKLEFSKNAEVLDEFLSSSIDQRISDLHEAFADTNVKGILTVIGGFNTNQLLKHIDWQLIKANPKVFCGFSIITDLNTAIYAKTGLVNYHGPHYSTFAQKYYLDYTIDYFKKCLMSDAPYTITPSSDWTDDTWYKDQESRNPIKNNGWKVINSGSATGEIIGGNITAFALLSGTEYFSTLQDKILFIEDDELTNASLFDWVLQSLILREDFKGVRGLVIGRFQVASKMTDEVITKIIQTKSELKSIPVISGVDFGHTEPKITLPIGGTAEMQASVSDNTANIRIVEH